jgi:hypothetical protein
MRIPVLALSLALTSISFAAPALASADLPRFELSSRLIAADGDEAEEAPKDEEGKESSSELPDAEVKVGGAQVGESMGGATGFVFKQGFYTQSDLGGFFRFGGYTISENCDPGVACESVFWSNLQPYIGLSAGYDIFTWLGVQLSFGTGFVANAAPYQDSPNSPRDYGVTMLNLGVVGSFYVLDRLAIAGKLFGGGTFLIPSPDFEEPFYGGNAGVGLGVRYATLLPDTFVGIDVNFHAAFTPDSGGGMLLIPGMSFAPIIKYVF